MCGFRSLACPRFPKKGSFWILSYPARNGNRKETLAKNFQFRLDRRTIGPYNARQDGQPAAARDRLQPCALRSPSGSRERKKKTAEFLKQKAPTRSSFLRKWTERSSARRGSAASGGGKRPGTARGSASAWTRRTGASGSGGYGRSRSGLRSVG